jgi:deazaflavin-dependent oxidoreductase (nitroreductase family)
MDYGYGLCTGIADLNQKNRQVIEEFRANGGIVTVKPPHGPVLILHTAGAKSGHECVTPLIYREDAGRYVIAASMGGWKRNPDWYYNILARPDDVWIEVGTQVLRVEPVVAQGEERDELFRRHCETYKQFAFYQGKTSRIIPVIVLVPGEAMKLSEPLPKKAG